MSGDFLYHNKIINSDIVYISVTLINDNNASLFNLSNPEYSTSSDDHSSFSNDNSHFCENIDRIDVVTAVNMVIFTNDPFVSLNDKHSDRYALTLTTSLVLSNGSKSDRDHNTYDPFSMVINHTQWSSANSPVVIDSGCNNYTSNGNL